MDKIETIENFKHFLNKNRNKLKDRTVCLSDLPKDDEWLNDDEWDEVYMSVKLRKRNKYRRDMVGSFPL